MNQQVLTNLDRMIEGIQTPHPPTYLPPHDEAPMRSDNSAHLLAAARKRASQTRRQAEAALTRITADAAPVTFDSVAREAGVSRSWLYAQPNLRAEIDRLRQQTPAKTAPAPPPPPQHASDTSTPSTTHPPSSQPRRRLQLEITSGRFTANAAWLVLACIAFNLMRSAEPLLWKDRWWQQPAGQHSLQPGLP
ncbi:DUF6262 family protein [Nakamurella sp. PAMC28650]|uniref:DUF6262 family protein n=1 Tax=Nakamurella sp. PAMC28650 TaxID=2762325 RepID=UPI00351BD580